jgi:hypothetical protein
MEFEYRRPRLNHRLTVGRSDYTLSEVSSEMPIPQFPPGSRDCGQYCKWRRAAS